MLKDAAFGIVPILNQSNPYQFLLIQHQAGHWGFPKGHADPGESALQTACREFTEETGITAYQVIENVSFSEQYSFTRNQQQFEKTVTYFPAWVESAVVQYQEKEIQAYTWADYDTAIALLSYEGAKRILTDAHHYLKTHFPI